ncbi:thioredoxin family protein [Methanosphaerula palustris]|uniref:Thioredoxin n=1 Tax=Methanosphaerula palustris (strain ATCC BAA-1556 / DSM 19958 / E1-9c) TaxID=521011 RepID=B8GF31_METPE|nr:thioredoxin family protein [Methanosphaerula palustris]ACL17837.1 redox-active disulfide protein 2 [Methanosphaerula palustris E1-9c]
MTTIEVIGTGCAKCHQLEKNVLETVKELGLTAEVVKVSDIAEIMKRGVIFTPALMVDGELKVSGRVPSVKELSGMLTKGK